MYVGMEESQRQLLNRLFPEQGADLENDEDVHRYLSKISTFGVEKLRAEGGRLQDEIALTQQQTQHLAFQNYKTFVETAECSSAVLREFTSVEERLDHLLTELPEFAARCAEFGRRGAEIHARRQLNSATLTKHTQLLEVLELPQLMDTAVRNGYYDQAMELVSHVRALHKKHGHIRLVETIVTDVQQAHRLMLTQLLSQLRTNVQLPECLRVVGHLRRMEVYTEFELRLKFLQARNAWLEDQLASINRDDSYHHISKTIEVSRVSLFDIVTQYRAVFSDDSALLHVSDDQAAPAVFHEWLNLKVEQLLSTLATDLERGAGAGGRLDALLSQTMYLGLSLARVGADLRTLAAPLFRRVARDRLRAGVAAATDRLRATLDAFTCLRPRASAGHAADSATTAAAEQDDLQAPLALLDYPPLAHYCNGVLTTFNELRLCPALSLVHDVSAILTDSLSQVVARAVDLYHTDSHGLTAAERSGYSRFCRCLACQLVPFLSTCVSAAFPADQLSATLGLTAAQLRKEGVGALDVASLVSPLQPFLADEPATEPAGLQNNKAVTCSRGQITDEMASTADAGERQPAAPAEEQTTAEVQSNSECSVDTGAADADGALSSVRASAGEQSTGSGGPGTSDDAQSLVEAQFGDMSLLTNRGQIGSGDVQSCDEKQPVSDVRAVDPVVPAAAAAPPDVAAGVEPVDTADGVQMAELYDDDDDGGDAGLVMTVPQNRG